MTRSANSTLVSLDDIRRAAATLRDVAVRTPLLRSYDLEQRVGVPVYLKPEMLQRGGAFKLRGAYTFVSRLSAVDRAKGLVAPSSGNHGQAVALAARLYGVKATIVMPTTAPRAKVAGAERLGGRVVFAGTTTAERMAKATEIVEQEGAILVPPYDDASIIAGQGTGDSRSPKTRWHSGSATTPCWYRWAAVGCLPVCRPRSSSSHRTRA